MSDTNRVRMGYQVETTYGEPLGTGSAVQELRFTRESLKPETRTTVSDEIRSDARTVDVLRTGFGVSGSVDAELSHFSQRHLYDSVFRNTTLNASVSATITATFTASGGTIDRASGNNTTDGFVAGNWVRISGAVNSANNGVFKIVTVTTTRLTVVGGTLVDETSTASVVVKMAVSGVDGTTQTSFSIEKEFLDNSTDFELMTGMIVDSWSLQVPVDGIVTQSFGFRGKSVSSETATMGNGTFTAVASSPPPIASVTGVHKACDNYTPINLISASLEYRNNLRPHEIMGTLGPTDFGYGRKELTGSIEAYYDAESLAIIEKNLATTGLTASSFAIVFKDTAGNYVIFDVPAIKYTDSERLTSGQSQDVRARLSFRGYYATTAYDLCQIRYSRIAA